MAFVWVPWPLVIHTENWSALLNFQTHCRCYMPYAGEPFFVQTLAQGLNGHVGISTSRDDVNCLPLKILTQTTSVAQDYFQQTQFKDKLPVTSGGQQGSALNPLVPKGSPFDE